MHRSGTSALTRVLGLLGADLPLNLLGANDGNEAGHWESVDLIAIHDNLLSSAGSTWDDWRPFNPDWTASPVASAYKQQIADAIEGNWPASPLFVVKDPRICRFVPVWLDVLDRIGVEPRIVIPARNPLEVAASLKRRNGFLPAKSYLLWLRHVLDAELSTRDLPRAFTTYDHLLTDWRSAVAQVAQKAGICWPRHSDFAELEIDKFLATTLRHHSFDAASLDARSEIVDWVKEAHDILSRMASGDRSRSHLTRLDQIRAEFEKASRVFGLVLAESEEKTAMVAQVHATESKQTHAQLAELEQEVARLREDARHEVTILRTEAEREVAQLRDEAEREATKLRDEAELARVFAAEQERLATERFIAIEEAGRREALLIRKIETTQTDLLAAVAERNEAQSQLEQSRREAATLRSDRDGARAGMREAQSQLQSLAGDLDAAQTALTQERKSRERALADVTRLAATADRLNAVEASLRFEKTLARRQADELARLRSALAEAVDAAQEQQHAAQMVLTEERAARELAQADVARLAATVDQLAASEASLKYERSLSGQQKHEIARLQSALAEAAAGAAARDAKSAAEAERAAAETRTLYAQTKELRETVVQQAVVIEDKAAPRRRVFPVWRSLRQRLSRWRRPDFEARAWEVEPIRRSKLFSALWYIEHNPDVAASGDDPLLHYLVHGGVDRRNPHPLFDARWYVAQYPQAAEAKMTPLTHYVTVGVSEGLDPMPLFDTDFYLCQNPDVAAANTNPLYHYWAYGAYEGRDPNPLFDSSWYLEQNRDVAAARDNPLLHYAIHGWKEGRDPHPAFDTKWYLEQNPDVTAAKIDPLTHYVMFGQKEGRQTRSARAMPVDTFQCARQESFDQHFSRDDVGEFSESEKDWQKLFETSGLFDAEWYLARYKDIARSRVDPFKHYLEFGMDEFRSPGPSFDPRWYVRENSEVAASGLNPLIHFLTIGKAKGLEASGTSYKNWCGIFDTLSPEDRFQILADIDARETSTVDIILLISSENQHIADRVLRSVADQLFKNFRVWIWLSTECSPELVDIMRANARDLGGGQFCIIEDAELKGAFKNGGISTVLVMGGGALLREHALYMFEREIHLNSELKLVYCDEDRIELSTNARSCPIFKPEFSPLLLSQKNYVGNCFLIRAGIEEFLSFVREKQCSEGFLESVLQSMRSQLSCANVLRIPSILFHDIAPTCPEPKSLTLIRDDALPGFSIIIPTRDKIEYLQPCIESIEGRSDYPAQKIEIIIVDNGSVELDTLSYLRALQTSGRAIVIRDDDKFNYSRLNNIAAARAAHEALLLLNNDTVVEDPLWLRRVATHVVEPDVGVVGAKLLFPDRTVQHGGVYLGIQGVAAHNLVGVNWNDPQLKLDLSREMSAVTGACLAIRRDVFFELGGLDENLPVAFNDTLLCLASLKAGYRNIYVREPLLIHFESKSRGYDDTPERKAAFQLEARYARSRFNEYFREDPFYSPNLCLQRVNELAYPPRKIKPWRTSRRNIDELKILFLSNVHGLGSGVAVVISLQAKHLSECGHKVYIGGPKGENEIAYEGCSRVILSDPEEAAAFAVREGIDCIVVETPPFFSVVRWLADWPRTLFLDHGEPPPDFFPDADNRKDVNFEKHFCFPLATATYAISESVRAEGGNGCAGIIRNANSHLGIWKDTLAGRRDEIRATYGWTHKTVVLNVCRIGRGERFYKGLDEYAFVLDELQRAKPELASSVVFVLCGKGAERDVVEMRQLGLEVFANVSDSKMIEMYLAADVYANFSRWEGYNLGIGQALAMGLPTIASDIPAHRAFPIFTSDDVGVIVEKLAELIQGIVSGGFRGTRKPIVTDWRNSLAVLEQSIIEICRSRVT